jgi:cytochrome c oxidase subunit 2
MSAAHALAPPVPRSPTRALCSPPLPTVALAVPPQATLALAAPRRPQLALLTLALTGCGGAQSILDPAGPIARELARLWWTFVAVCGAIYLLVLATLLAATLLRRRRGADEAPDPEPQDERGGAVVVAGASALSVLVVFGLTLASFATGRAVTPPFGHAPLTVRVIGHQWWWELRYDAATPSDVVTTANELHLPAGRPVDLVLSSVDVIHSLWIPTLNGKRDLIPGQETYLTLVADRPGSYRGQCAEFCGAQHAHMALDVVVHVQDDFDAWLASARAPAAAPADASQERGRQVFLAARCPMCHAITGIDAYGRVGPDLTHLASRRSLAAGSMPNTRGHLAGWIVDPQGVKQGARMPPNALPPDDLQALLAYLGSLR